MRDSHRLVVRDGLLLVHGAGSDVADAVQVGTRRWYEWLEENASFVFEGSMGHLTARREMRRGRPYWYGYRRRGGRLLKTYLGRTQELTLARLEEASAALAGQISFAQLARRDRSAALVAPVRGDQNAESGEPDLSLLPMTQVTPPALPGEFVARPRVAQRINAPVTIIAAPSGFGKTTVVNEWRQHCGMPVAWVTLDTDDNNPLRFWSKVVTALQMVNPDLGRSWLSQLRASSASALSKIVFTLTNDILRATSGSSASPGIGLVLDNYHHIHNTEVHTSLQTLLEHIPPALRLVVAGSARPPLALGYLKAKGMVVELGASDLRFTMEEGLEFLRRHAPWRGMAYSDMEAVVRRTEGWVTGLVLATYALTQSEDRAAFVDAFTGTHSLLREFFMSSCFGKQPPEVQAFLLKTSVLKYLTGPLCDAVLGQSGSGEILARLLQENVFIERLEESDWYRYHDLFAEMLRGRLEEQFPAEVARLHRRAARWYRGQNDVVNAIEHLVAGRAWEEAAALMESSALRDLQQTGDDGRLLRWLRQLPETVLRQHRTLLAAYVRLASIAWPRSEVEGLLARVEAAAGVRPSAAQTDADQGVVSEIQKIRRLWSAGDSEAEELPVVGGEEAGWRVLDGILRCYRDYRRDVPRAEATASAVYEAAKESRNLYGILVAGGGCANLALSQGHLRRSEQIANEVLRWALELRGAFPESASIALAALSNVCFMRTQLAQAHQLLVRATEVAPNPASANEAVAIAILRAKIESARGDKEAALATIQAARELHTRRPSSLWSDQDLASYQALFCFRRGDVPSAERLLSEGGEVTKNPFAALVRAEMLIEQGRNIAAEEIVRHLLKKHPYGAYLLPTMRARVILAIALFNQRKVNEARQVMAKAARLAAPEYFNRPFLDYGNQVAPLLSLVLHTANLNAGTRSFLKGTLAMLGHAGAVGEVVSVEEPAALSIAASISPREQEVLRMVSAGLSNQEIAAALYISPSTVKTHLENIYLKLGVTSRTQAIAQAHALKLL